MPIWEKTIYLNKFSICAPIVLQIFLSAPLWPKDSKSVLGFGIGAREGGEKMDRQTDKLTYVDFNIDS